MDIVEFLKTVVSTIEKSIKEINNIILNLKNKESVEYKTLVRERTDEIKINDFLQMSKKEFQIIRQMLKKYKTVYFKNWKEYNTIYQGYLQIIIRDIMQELQTIKQFKKITRTNYEKWEFHLNRLKKLNKNSDIMLPFSSNLSRHYILCGKNGVGKTKLLNLIQKRMYGNEYYITASRDTSEADNSESIHGKLANCTIESLLQSFIKLACKELFSKNKYHILANGKKIKNSYKLFLEMYDRLNLNRKIKINFDKKTIELYNDKEKIPAYDITEASDGEKAIIQILLYVFLVPKNSYIMIDEPELHINPAIVNDFFNSIETFRQDLVFIYSSHSIEFIESRQNAKLIYIKSYNGETWDYEYLEDKSLGIKHILEIIGSREPIIYIEGDYQSIDYKIYSKIFKEFKIIPVASCTEVIKICKSIHRCNLNYNGKIYGIIDNDFKSDAAISKYKNDNIYTLPCSEIENLLFHPLILEHVLKKNNSAENNAIISKLKKVIIEDMKTNREEIIKDFINKNTPIFNKKPKYNSIDIESLKYDINENFNSNMNEFIDKVNKFIVKLDESLNSNDYNQIYIYPNKGIKSALNKINLTFSNYQQKIEISLEENEKFRKEIVSKIFGNLGEI